ncbi:Qat anti-phage system associated protein QatB [Sphingobium sp. AN641]|uniref:Qat anti-phage system associated protein QatB n=1 Tax=Sphingobium sp. AN641 TaxID=3133443 RepID=UPI0030C00571
MGTSASSRGPGAGVPMVPDWVPPATPDGQGPTPQPTPDAPARRFQPARTRLGKYGGSGSADDLRKGLGHYSKGGLGGASTAARRMAGTAQTAGGLFGVLSALSTGTAIPSDVPLDTASLAGKSQSEIADIIAETLRPVDGTQDGEAARDAVSRALSEILEQDPNADLTALGDAQIDQVIESYVAHDLAHRIELDVGKAVLDKAPNYATGADRLEEMKAFVRQEVARAFRARQQAGAKMDRQNAATLSGEVLRDTFEIFESYI